jgi:thiazole synthase
MTQTLSLPTTDTLSIGGREFESRLMLGTGKFRDFGLMREAIEASGTQIITVAIRRVELNAPGHEGLLDALDLDRLQLLPNTAGCRTSAEALRVARLARALTGVNWVKLEVIPDPRSWCCLMCNRTRCWLANWKLPGARR